MKSFADIVARGGTFQLRVFDASGNFLTAEIATFKPSSDGRRFLALVQTAEDARPLPITVVTNWQTTLQK